MKQKTKDKISKTMQKLIWINNGIEQIRVLENKIPKGYIRGQLFNNNTKFKNN